MIGDVHTTSVNASFGALTHSDESDSRILTVGVRVGDYRVIYSVLANEVAIEIIRVRHRKDVYRGL